VGKAHQRTRLSLNNSTVEFDDDFARRYSAFIVGAPRHHLRVRLSHAERAPIERNTAFDRAHRKVRSKVIPSDIARDLGRQASKQNPGSQRRRP